MNDVIDLDNVKMIAEIKTYVPMALQLPEPDKSRCLLCLAYEYFMMDMEEEAYKLLLFADSNYFKDQLKIDMKTVPNMDKVVMRIARKLILIGVVV